MLRPPASSVILVALVYAAAVRGSEASSPNGDAGVFYYAPPGPVETIGWDADMPLSSLAESRVTPAVIDNPPMSLWPAFETLEDEGQDALWRWLGCEGDSDGAGGGGGREGAAFSMPESIAADGVPSSNATLLRGVQVSTDPRLVYEREQTSAAFGEASSMRRVDLKPCVFRDRLLAAASAGRSEFVRYSAGIAAHPAALREAFGGDRLAGLGGYCRAASGGSVDDPEVNLWVSGRGAVTAAHYDSSFNFFTQVAGRKRFLLFPPKEWAAVGSFPEAHRRSRQCPRRPAPAPREVSEARARGLVGGSGASLAVVQGALEVVLNPGETLFLPSHWFHEVTSLDDVTVSVNAWCPRALAVEVAKVFARGNEGGRLVPISDDWEPQQKVIGLDRLVRQLVGRVLGTASVRPFLRSLETARFAHLAGQPPADDDSRYAHDLCHASDIRDLREALYPQMVDIFKGPLRRLSRPFSKSDAPRSVIEMTLADVVERLSYAVTRREMHPFIKHCLADVPVRSDGAGRRRRARG